MWNYYNPFDIIFGKNKFSELKTILENKKSFDKISSELNFF